jgi:hypothetical protein
VWTGVHGEEGEWEGDWGEVMLWLGLDVGEGGFVCSCSVRVLSMRVV